MVIRGAFFSFLSHCKGEYNGQSKPYLRLLLNWVFTAANLSLFLLCSQWVKRREKARSEGL